MDYPSYPHVLFEKSRGIGRVTLNRPEKRNALRKSDLEDLVDCLRRVQADSEVRVLILRGAGHSFCSGRDMNESNEAWYGTDFAVAHEQLAWERFVHLRQYFWGLWTLFWELPQITIAQVQGHAIEVGQELAMLCDLCVAADDAQFVLEPVFAVGGKFTNLWPLLMGIKKSKEVMLTGGSLTGKQAAELGLVNRVVSQDRLDAEVGALAGEIAQLPIEFIHFNKLSINKFFEAMGVRGAIESSINTHVMGTMFDTSQELRRRVQEQGWRARDKFLEQDVRRQPQ